MPRRSSSSNISSNIPAADGSELPKVPGLTRKKSAYFHVRRIPEDIRHMFEGRQQVWTTLGTTDYRVASERARLAAADTDRQFNAARLGRSPDQKEQKTPQVSLIQIQQAAKLHLFQREKAVQKWDGDLEIRHMTELDLAHLASMDEEVWAPAIQKMAGELAARLKLPISDGDRMWHPFVDLVRRAEIEHLERELGRMDAVPREKSHDHIFADVFSHTPAPKPVERAGLTLGQMIARFESDPTRGHLTESAAKKYILPFAALREVVGDDRALEDVSRFDCVEAFQIIAALPPNYTKYERYRGKTLREVGMAADEIDANRLAPGTAHVYAHHLSAFFNYAVQKGVLDNNPATRLSGGAGRQPSPRRPFTLEELQSVFAALPAWDAGKSGGRLWAPVVSLWTGMRLGEVVTLMAADIRLVDGVDVIVLTKTNERSLKTPGAARIIPIHSELKQLGFEAVVTRAKQGNGRLFPDLPGCNQREVADLFQKRFSYFLGRGVRPAIKGVSFHSFRHGFRDALREGGIPMDAVRALGGWSRTQSVEERYGQGLRASTLAHWIEKVRYPGLDLSNLNARQV